MNHPQQTYWNSIADDYQQLTTISTEDFHFGPLLPGNRELNLLPPVGTGTTCLELGCGGGQNSIYLAHQGAACTAIDISEKQIRHARKLAAENNLDIDFRVSALENQAVWPQQQFDLVHSVYTLPFIEAPEEFIRRAAACAAPGGTLLLAAQHPVFSGEWLEIEDEETGLFLTSYFEPPEDIRVNPNGQIIASRAYPISEVSEWIYAAGLRNLRIFEPQPLPLARIKEAPYHSPAWIELHPKLSAIPVSIIYTAIAPSGSDRENRKQPTAREFR